MEPAVCGHIEESLTLSEPILTYEMGIVMSSSFMDLAVLSCEVQM